MYYFKEKHYFLWFSDQTTRLEIIFIKFSLLITPLEELFVHEKYAKIYHLDRAYCSKIEHCIFVKFQSVLAILLEGKRHTIDVLSYFSEDSVSFGESETQK